MPGRGAVKAEGPRTRVREVPRRWPSSLNLGCRLPRGGAPPRDGPAHPHSERHSTAAAHGALQAPDARNSANLTTGGAERVAGGSLGSEPFLIPDDRARRKPVVSPIPTAHRGPGRLPLPAARPRR